MKKQIFMAKMFRLIFVAVIMSTILMLSGCGVSKSLTIIEDGSTDYCIMIPQKTENYVKEAANELAKAIYDKTKVNIKIFSDNATTDMNRIYIGQTTSQVSKDVYDTLPYGAYEVGSSNQDLYVAAYNEKDMENAALELKKVLLDAWQEEIISVDAFNNRTESNESLLSIPKYATNKATSIFGVGGASREIYIKDGDSEDFVAYTKQLKEEGYIEVSSKKIGNAEYAVMKNEEMVLYVNQFASAMRIVYERAEDAYEMKLEPDFEKVCKTKGYMVGVTPGEFENGMCFYYLLADGTFLVYDGGTYETDADNLYNLLCKTAVENGIEKVKISAWICSHAHIDHMGCWSYFCQKYASEIAIGTVMFNRSTVDQGAATTDSKEGQLQETIQKYSPNTKLVQLHSGQEFYLADVKVEVIYTLEDLPENTFEDYNDASTVTRLTINGKTILMTADAAFDTWDLLCETWGTALQSDYLQVPHHGAHHGGTVDAYNYIKPTYLLFPSGDKLYKDNLTTFNKYHETNVHLLSMVSPENIMIAGIYDVNAGKGRVTEFIIGE